MKEFISDEMAYAIKKIAKQHPEVIFCGSLGLILNGLLKRKVKDIDVLVDRNYYSNGGFFDDNRINTLSNSHIFMVGVDKIFCFNIKLLDVNIDVLYNETGSIKYKELKFEDIIIRVEEPEYAINVKLEYIINDKSVESVIKHVKDLIYLEVDKEVLIKAIDKASVFGCKVYDYEVL